MWISDSVHQWAEFFNYYDTELSLRNSTPWASISITKDLGHARHSLLLKKHSVTPYKSSR